jgi:hypothetical protein
MSFNEKIDIIVYLQRNSKVLLPVDYFFASCLLIFRVKWRISQNHFKKYNS